MIETTSQLLPILVAVAVVLAILALGVLLMLLLGNKESEVQRRLTSIDTTRQSTTGGNRMLGQLAEGGKGIDALFKDDEGIDLLLAQAGWRGTQSRANFYILQVLLPVGAVLLFLFMWLTAFQHMSSGQVLMFAFAAVALGFLAPRFILRSIAAQRLDRIRTEVPLMINLLMLLYEAGLSTRQALTSLVRDGQGVLPELSQEFRIALRQIEAGEEVSEALLSVNKALQVSELGTVLSVLRQAERYGGEVREPLAEALDVMEERRGLSLREKVNGLSGRMTVVMVGFFFPALLLFIAGPAVLAVFSGIRSIQ